MQLGPFILSRRHWTQESPVGAFLFTLICDEFYGNGDHFGEVLRAGDYNNDGRADLAVSAPGKSLTADVGHEGMVFALTSGGNVFDSDPRNFSSARSLRQGSDGVNDLGQANDRFGQ
ncbi:MULTISPECIES: FG-GAP repeat protein [Sorangium]|uniref:FG-GAP repeat protein n=1 Tax=Sorangium TaxID=39643 RepID=UPI0012FFC163|nr:FG-GAP repeat protein [Sorangium cellulosum]